MKSFISNFSGRLILLTGFIFITAFACNSPESVRLSRLQVEYLTNPLGIDTPEPRFSWNLESDNRGVYQSAYQIVVGVNPSEVKKRTGSVWDSGRISDGNTVNIEYTGPKLQSNQPYYWSVGVWLETGESFWSEPAFFHTGMLDASGWQANWITTEEPITDKSPVFRKEFSVNKKVERAYAYVTACGFYEFFLNGSKVGDHVMDPGITDYRKTILYSTYDVTSLLKKGANAAGAMLGNGAWNLRKTQGRWSWGQGGATFGNPCLFVQLMITYADGSTDVVTSDTGWKYADGPVTFNNLYGGEDYDARLEMPGWAEKGFDDSAWKQAVLAATPSGRLKSQMMQPIRVNQTITPVAETNPSPGVYLYDLGQNISGWWRLEVKGNPGQVIRIRGAETLNDSLFPKPLEAGDRLSTKFKYHAEVWTDYTLKGTGLEVYEPRFFYSGFRYIEVSVSDETAPAHLKVEGRVGHSDLARNGMFETSDSLLNRIHRAGVWSQKGNSHAYPTDCPHREKGAYNGDGQVIAETSMHDFHMAPYYTKWVNDMRDAQEENGRIPNTSPTLVGGMGGGVAWGSAYVLIPWWMYHYYNDTRILQEHYPTMKRYVEYLRNLATIDKNPEEPFIINYFDGYWFSLGEWCAPGQKDCPVHDVVNTFYYYHNSHLLSEIAGVLGFTEDAGRFSRLADTVRTEFNKRFFNPETALYGTDSTYQTYQLLALVGELVPDGYRDQVFRTIVDDMKMRDGHLNTGIIGTKYLWPVLVRGGEAKLAFEAATKTTFPSYGYWIENGSTTLLEEWSGEHSHNHQMFGSVVEYFYKYLAGIQSPMEGNTSKGYRNVHIEPYIPGNLSFVKSSLETVSGMVSSSWQQEPGVFKHQVNIPANTTATVALPVKGISNPVVMEGTVEVWSGDKNAANAEGITDVWKEGDRIILKLRSGAYNFRVESKP